ncbi:hypothetical protein Dda_2919 [Drechslerella dactyloides]|uniref:Uncharacterized protein n=1 Tax=Drechslerella dactyloides TaxID=74499 RepID=A0AAD6J1Y6_DREDA|nr:hypothetical protein Dda_2919 [Drechslerella dactyloides]
MSAWNNPTGAPLNISIQETRTVSGTGSPVLSGNVERHVRNDIVNHFPQPQSGSMPPSKSDSCLVVAYVCQLYNAYQ